MRLAATSSPLARRRQAGLGTLLVAVVLLLLVMVLIATVSRTMVVEQRMSANQVRAKQAHEAAQAGIDAAMTYITTGVGGTDRNGDNIADDLASVTLSTGASYRAAFCHPEDTATAITCSDTSGTRPGCNYLDNLTPAGGNAPQEATFLNTPLIVACGWSDDNIAKKTIRQHVGAVPALADPPTMPITAKGAINVSGAVTVDNLFNNLTIWSGQPVTNVGASGRTAVLDPACPTQDPTAALLASNDPCLLVTSQDDVIGPDVISSDISLASLSTDEMFSNFTGAPNLSTYRDRVGVRTLSNAEAQTLDDNGGVKGQAVVIQNDNEGTGDITLPNGTIGSRERPVVLIINGNWTGGNVTVFGAIYVRGNITLAGNPVVQGAVLVEGNVGGTGNLTVRYSPFVMENAANRTGRPGLIPGSWRDWN